MAKAKGGFKPADLKKHYFWIVLPLLVILALVFTFVARGSIKKAYEEKTTAITAAKEGADSVASDKKHPNDATIKAIKDETNVLADNVYNAWQLMYSDQKIRNRWPRQLSTEFLDLVENKLNFKDPIGVGKPYLLEDYGYFIGRHLPDLIKEMNRRRCQVMDYKLLKKAELNNLQLSGYDERFWPIYVDKDADGVEFLYIGVHNNPEDENSPLADAFLYNHENDIVSRFEDQELYNAILKKEKHEHYYLDVDPWILTPKDMIIWGVQANDLQNIVQAIASAGAEGGAAGGMAGGGSMMGGASSMMGGGAGGARGSLAGDSMSGGMGGMGSELSGLGIGAVPGDGVDPATEQVVGTSLEEIGGGGLTGGGMGGVGGGMGAGAGRMGGMSAGGGGRTGGMGVGGGGRMAGGGGGRVGGMGGSRAGGMGGSLGGDTMGGASAEDPSWSEKIYPGLPSYKERRRIVGNVDWPDPEIYSLPTWDQTASHPESVEVWYAQETLWVYEALIRVIAETNKEYPDNISKAPVKCIEQMLIGQNAAVEWLNLSQTIGDLTGQSAAGMSGALAGDSMSSSSMMGPTGGADGGFSLSGNAEEQAMTKILTGRYIGEDNTPLKADDKPPFSEFNMMPVCLKLAMDQRHIPDLLVSCANSAMPIDVKHVRVCPDNNVPFVMPIPLENMGGEGGSGASMMGGMGMDMMGGSMMGGSMSGAAGGMGGDAASGRGGRGGRGAAGGMGGDMMGGMGGVEIGRSELSQTEYGVDTIRVEVYGVINIFNKPNKAAFATGASAEEADAEAEATLAAATKTEGDTEEGAESAESEATADNTPATESDGTTAAEPAAETTPTDAAN